MICARAACAAGTPRCVSRRCSHACWSSAQHHHCHAASPSPRTHCEPRALDGEKRSSCCALAAWARAADPLLSHRRPASRHRHGAGKCCWFRQVRRDVPALRPCRAEQEFAEGICQAIVPAASPSPSTNVCGCPASRCAREPCTFLNGSTLFEGTVKLPKKGRQQQQDPRRIPPHTPGSQRRRTSHGQRPFPKADKDPTPAQRSRDWQDTQQQQSSQADGSTVTAWCRTPAPTCGTRWAWSPGARRAPPLASR